MRIMIFILALLGIGIGAWLILAKPKNTNETAAKPLAISKHSEAFNASLDSTLNSYYKLTDHFVQWDSIAVEKQAVDLKNKLDNIRLTELQKDTSGILETAQSFVDNAKNDIHTIETEKALVDKRHALNSLTDNLFNFLRVVRYDREKLYLQECPMAFNDTEPGSWLSKTAQINNPYLGLHHPYYGKGMLHCGETKDTLNFLEAK